MIKRFLPQDKGRPIEFFRDDGLIESGKLKSFNNDRGVAFVTFGLPNGKEVTTAINFRDLKWPK